eukprot:5877816-Prymnesium_polylepis.1
MPPREPVEPSTHAHTPEAERRESACVSYEKQNQKWVGMMYNEEKFPRRRIYVNGYYSEWFPIRS